MIHIGIDPGAHGAIAVIDEDGVPLTHKLHGMTERDVWQVISATRLAPSFAILEAVHSMPGQGVASTWKFSGSYHGLRMALIAAEIPFETVTPQKWQRCMGCLTHGDKNITKAKAQELFPQIKVTHDIADALIIAEYCRRTHNG